MNNQKKVDNTEQYKNDMALSWYDKQAQDDFKDAKEMDRYLADEFQNVLKTQKPKWVSKAKPKSKPT